MSNTTKTQMLVNKFHMLVQNTLYNPFSSSEVERRVQDSWRVFSGTPVTTPPTAPASLLTPPATYVKLLLLSGMWINAGVDWDSSWPAIAIINKGKTKAATLNEISTMCKPH